MFFCKLLPTISMGKSANKYIRLFRPKTEKISIRGIYEPQKWNAGAIYFLNAVAGNWQFLVDRNFTCHDSEALTKNVSAMWSHVRIVIFGQATCWRCWLRKWFALTAGKEQIPASLCRAGGDLVAGHRNMHRQGRAAWKYFKPELTKDFQVKKEERIA